MRTLVLSRRDVEAVSTMPMAVDAVEEAFAAYARGEAEMPPKVYLDLPDHEGDFRAMPSRIGGAGGEFAGVKWVNSHPKNPERFGLPSVMGLYVLSDPKNAPSGGSSIRRPTNFPPGPASWRTALSIRSWLAPRSLPLPWWAPLTNCWTA